MIIYGKQLILHVVKRRVNSLKNLYLSKEIDKGTFSILGKSGIKIIKVDSQKAQAMAHGGNHQGFLAEVDEYEFACFDELKKLNNLVLLYNLSDVGNIGSIARSAYALGVDGMIIIAKSVAMEGVIRASSGAAYELPIALAADGLSTLNELKQVGFKIFAASMGAKTPEKTSGKNVLVMGSEGFGIPKKALEKCDEQIGIKMRDGWDSLNVGVAFGILFDRMING